MRVSIITPAHNEEDVIASCIQSIKNLKVPDGISIEHMVVADRCTDKTVDICEELGVKVLEKNWRGDAVDPVTEVIDYGVQKTRGEIIGKVDADIILPQEWLIEMLKYMDEKTVSVSSRVKTRTGKLWLDLLMRLRDINYRVTPLGEEPRGAARLINRELLNEIGGFDYEWPSWDTGLDRKIKTLNYRSLLVKKVTATEYRPSLTIQRVIRKQIKQGMARKMLGTSLLRTAAHSFFRLRFFVLFGYLLRG